MKTVAIIQARLGSTRLPNKVLMDLCGKPLICHVIERAQAIRNVDKVVLNVPAEDAIAFAKVTDCTIYAVPGQQNDVLGSYRYVASETGADVIVRITGDCPLLAPDLSAEVVDMFLKQRPDYCANIGPYTQWADGWDTEVFSWDALNLADRKAVSPYARQHVTVMMRQLCACLYGPKAPEDWSKVKWSVDTADDFAEVEWIVKHLPPGQFGWQVTDRTFLRTKRIHLW